MKRLIKKSEITDGFKFNDEKKYTYVYTNPSASEVEKTIASNKFRSIRGLIYNNGEVIIWPGNILHDEINGYTHEKLDLSQLHFEVMDNEVSIYCYHEYSIDDVRKLLKNTNSSLKNVINGNDQIDFYYLKLSNDINDIDEEELDFTLDQLLQSGEV